MTLALIGKFTGLVIDAGAMRTNEDTLRWCRGDIFVYCCFDIEAPACR